MLAWRGGLINGKFSRAKAESDKKVVLMKKAEVLAAIASITAGEADAPHCELLKYHREFKSLGYNECPDCGAPLT